MSVPFTTCLWFDTQAEEAAQFYCSLFEDSTITGVTRYPSGSPQEGTVLTVDFTLRGMPYVGLNGGPMFRFTEAISFQVYTDDQAETDHYWDALVADGGEESMCGWLKDRFGLSWQIVPRRLTELLSSPEPEVAGRASGAMMTMHKIDIATIEAAAAGEPVQAG